MRKLPRIALLIDTTRSFGQELVRGIVQFTRYQGPWSFWNEPSIDQQKIFKHLKEWNADVIVAQVYDKDYADRLHTLAQNVIVVVCDDFIDGHVNVIGDYQEDGRICAEYLIKKGLKNLAFCGLDALGWSRKREEGFKKAVSEAGMESMHFENPYLNKKVTWHQELNAIGKWLADLPKPCGLMACNDIHAARILEAAKIFEVKIPSEIALIGVDNDDMICELTTPPLSSLGEAVQQAGHDTAEVIAQMLKGRVLKSERIAIKPTIVVTRQSTDIMAVQDSDVAKAIEYINAHCRENLQVVDVVEHTGTNRRTLERKFKSYLERTISDEIRRVRTDLICKMLLETNYSILHIARAIGFNGLEHISRYFRKEKGVSLVKYRKTMRQI